jgi:hypothetical protein
VSVFGAGAGQHRQEPAALAGDVVHGGAVGQLVVGHVEELGPAKQVTQPVPGGDVGRVVGGVAIGGPVADRHRPVTGDGEDPHQLLEVGPVILGVATHQSRGALAAAEAPGRGPVRRPVSLIEVESLCSSPVSTSKASTTRSVSVVSMLARSASNNASSARPTRSSPSAPTWPGASPSSGGRYRPAQRDSA